MRKGQDFVHTFACIGIARKGDNRRAFVGGSEVQTRTVRRKEKKTSEMGSEGKRTREQDEGGPRRDPRHSDSFRGDFVSHWKKPSVLVKAPDLCVALTLTFFILFRLGLNVLCCFRQPRLLPK